MDIIIIQCDDNIIDIIYGLWQSSPPHCFHYYYYFYFTQKWSESQRLRKKNCYFYLYLLTNTTNARAVDERNMFFYRRSALNSPHDIIILLSSHNIIICILYMLHQLKYNFTIIGQYTMPVRASRVCGKF